METTLVIVIEVEQSQMQPLEVEPQSKLVEEDMQIVDLKVGTKPLVVIQNETIETVVGQIKA